jgi:hypothetical protein
MQKCCCEKFMFSVFRKSENFSLSAQTLGIYACVKTLGVYRQFRGIACFADSIVSVACFYALMRKEVLDSGWFARGLACGWLAVR